MVTVIRHCGHIFNTDELNTWFRNHCNCPVCRYDIRGDNSNASSAFSSENQNTSNNTSSLPSSQNNRNENISSNSNVERNSSATFVTSMFDALINEYGSDIINILNYTDASGNDNSSGQSRLLRQLNNRNHPPI
jgi:hypothetical protein